MNVWVEAARPRTLPAGVAPVLVGTAAADRFVAWRFGAALVVALALQVAVNYANDHADGVAGVDTPDRVGPRRAVAAGLVAPAAMQRATAVALGVAGVAGLTLAAAVGWELLVVGALAGLAALGYSGGPSPYASRALGEVFVFLFFGLVATVGSQYVQDEAWSWAAVLAAVPVGFLAAAILVVNNLRDIPTDAAAGKRTLAVRLGDARTRRLYLTLVWAAYVLLIPIMLVRGEPGAVVAAVSVPMAWQASRLVRGARDGRRMIRALELSGQLELAYGALLAAGFVLDRTVG